MIIAFAGHHAAFDFQKIGGTDALVRRLALQIAETEPVFVLSYGHAQAHRAPLAPNVTHLCCTDFADMLATVAHEGITDVVTIYFPVKDRLKLLTHRSPARFHTILTTYNSNLIKRWGLFALSALCFDGLKFAVSKRLAAAMRRWPGGMSGKTELLWPPVEDAFFLEAPAPATPKAKKRIAYMGRLDWGKGADLAIDFFETTKLSTDDYEFFVYAYPWANDLFSQKLHVKLKAHPKITYVEAELIDDLDVMDRALKESIDAVDVFVLPYRVMLSTIDSPLVPMEIAARGRTFVTTDIEGLPTLPVKTGTFLSRAEMADGDVLENAIVEALAALPGEIDKSYRASAMAMMLRRAMAALPLNRPQ